MIIEIGSLKIEALGDQHLGKKFERGVPLHRRGDREKMQWADFRKSLLTPCDVHVNMGDMYDQWYVSYQTIFRAAESYRDAALANPKRPYYILMGNHDASRDLQRVSAFKIFAEIVRSVPNIIIVDEQVEVYVGEKRVGGNTFLTGERLVFMPWSPVNTAAEMVALNAHLIENADATFHHCDVDMRAEDFNKLPAAALAAIGVKRAITGHDHVRREIVMDGLPVLVTGSMQPYSHSEDTEGKLYRTITLDEIDGDYKDMCIRVQLKKGEVLETPPNCLQLTLQYEDADEGEEEVSVQFEKFDFNKLFNEAFAAEGVSAETTALVHERWEIERSKL